MKNMRYFLLATVLLGLAGCAAYGLKASTARQAWEYKSIVRTRAFPTGNSVETAVAATEWNTLVRRWATYRGSSRSAGESESTWRRRMGFNFHYSAFEPGIGLDRRNHQRRNLALQASKVITGMNLKPARLAGFYCDGHAQSACPNLRRFGRGLIVVENHRILGIDGIIPDR